MTEAIRVKLPCTCGKVHPTLIHFEVVDGYYESSPGALRKVGDVMPADFPEREMEVEGLADACPCGSRQRVVITFRDRRIVNLRRSPGRVRMDSMPVIEAPVYIDEADLKAGLASPVGLKENA
jgi:hypothetical protein